MVLPNIVFAAFASTAIAAAEEPSQRIDLGEALLMTREGNVPRALGSNIILHLHGSAPVVEQAFADSGWKGSVLLFNRKGLSSVYEQPFAQPALFPRLLEKAQAALAKSGHGEESKIGRVFVSSFSAGFGGIRAVLAVPAQFARIDGVILADSLYAGYQGDPTSRRIDPAKMAGFRRFATEAASGRKTMVVTHSAQVPSGYASTTETADDLIQHVGGHAVAVNEDWGDGWRLTRRFSKGRLLILGFSGETAADHMRHLRRLGLIWRAALDVERRSPVETRHERSLGLARSAAASDTRSVEVPVGKTGEVHLGEIVARLANVSGVPFERPPGDLTLSTQGLARALTKTLLSETLGPEVAITFERGMMVMMVDERILAPQQRAEWQRRLRELADRAGEASRRRQVYGMRALNSFRPNDANRPTICLVHGMNSSSHGFVHMIPLLEEAGYGIVVYDYPFNRSLEESCAGFARDWAVFRRQVRDNQRWLVVAHSMGALLARSLVEDDASWAGDVSALVLIAPVNQGSHLARVQTAFQLINGLNAINGKNTTQAMLHLSDGLGQAAADLLPGSVFLKNLNRRPRRQGVKYHILAGDSGFLTRAARKQYEDRLDLVTHNSGVFGRLTRVATADLPEILDELTDGTGDGCVALARTRLQGVTDCVTLHANHAELIRAPLLFPDPGPVACLPIVLRWLKEDITSAPETRAR